MKDHMVRQENIRDICPYCSSHISSRQMSKGFEFHDNYSMLKCDCGRNISLKFDCLTSGVEEDPIKETEDNSRMRTLESRIQIVKEYKEHSNV